MGHGFMGTRGLTTTRLRAVAAVALAGVIWLPAFGTVRAGDFETVLDEPLTVMTRNVFLGTNLQPVLDVATRLPAEPSAADLRRLAETTATMRAQVDATDFGLRAELIAEEIGRHEPALIGLQEVALWRSGPHDPGKLGVPDATLVDHDFLVVLLAALEAEELDYSAVVTVDEVDLEMPALVGGTLRDIRVTLRDVILVRDSDDVVVQDSGRAHFDSQRRIRLPRRSAEFTRGYGWVDVVHDDDLVRFVNTHLEVGDPRIGYAQARELVTGPAYVDRPVVVVCDCNSNPQRRLRSLPYRTILGAGFVDQWLTLDAGPGHTCCVPNTLRPEDPALMDHRVDFVFARATRRVGATYGVVLGGPDPDQPLRPSDHAGLVVRIRSA